MPEMWGIIFKIGEGARGPGDKLVVYVEDGRIVIDTPVQLTTRIKRDVADAWTGTGTVVDELINDRRAEARTESAD